MWFSWRTFCAPVKNKGMCTLLFFDWVNSLFYSFSDVSFVSFDKFPGLLTSWESKLLHQSSLETKQGKCFLDTDLCLAILLCSMKLLESLLFLSFWEHPWHPALLSVLPGWASKVDPSAHLVIWYFEHSVYGAKLFVASPKPFSEPLQVSLKERSYKKKNKMLVAQVEPQDM